MTGTTPAARGAKLAAVLLTALSVAAATTPASAATAAPARTNLLSSSCPSVVQQPENDGCVTELQILLDNHGASPQVGVTGTFDSTTLAATKAFQSAHGLTVDGQVGPNTKAALYYVDPSVPINLESLSCSVDIAQGENNGCVEELQNLLNQHGAGLSVDHDFGPLTSNAVSSYQASVGLPATGVVDPSTKAELYGQPAPTTPPDLGAGRYAAIVQFAQNAVADNIQYVWAGGHNNDFGPSIGSCTNYSGAITPCPAATSVGLDCSGLTRWLYWQAGAGDIGQVTGDQITNPRFRTVSQSAAIPGDLVFFGSSVSTVHHVGVYTGTVNGVPMMINAPYTGVYVRSEPVSDVTDLIGYYHLTS
jgi:peptidoglycan hydrolase-like protein with peptidoglycan-binding domain